jgi:xylulokinase
MNISKVKIATLSIGLAVGSMAFQSCDSLTKTQKGAGIGAGIYSNANEAFASLEKLQVIEPKAADQAAYAEAYARWKEVLASKM